MWTIHGPFDVEKPESKDPKILEAVYKVTKTKLLKTNKSYTLGRKNQPLLIQHGKISVNHAQFIVGELSEDDVNDPSIIPTLQLYNARDKESNTITVLNSHGERRASLPIHNTMDLADGDVVCIITDMKLTVRWERVCCYVPPSRVKLPFHLSACASIGVNVVSVPHTDATHFLTPSFALTPPAASALLGSLVFVKPEWAAELLRLGELPAAGDAGAGLPLERELVLPPPAKFRPAFTAALPAPLKQFRPWEPNEERLGMLHGLRFLCVGEKGREVAPEVADVIKRGGAECETFAAGDGVTKFSRAIKKAKTAGSSPREVILIANEDAVKTALGEDVWAQLTKEAKSAGLHFVDPSMILQAIGLVDKSVLRSSGGRDESPLPDVVPNTHPDEPSIPPESESMEDAAPPPRRLTRRAGSRASSPERRASVPPEDSAPAPRKALTRRAKAGAAVIIGIDDASILDDETPAQSQVAPAPTPAPGQAQTAPVPPTPARPSRLKRRAGTSAPTQLFGDADSPAAASAAPADEPPLKKFKALFEESDPARLLASSQLQPDSDGWYDPQSLHAAAASLAGLSGASQTQGETQAQRSGARAPPPTALPAVREEEEEETQASLAAAAARLSLKRKADRDADGDVEMGPPPVPAKKRKADVAAPAASSEKDAKQEKTSAGAAPGVPDTDAAFLQAVASRKRGKRKEDATDREFNNLRITKPDLERDEEEGSWKIVEDFGDADVRGNFMVVVEIEVPREAAPRARIRDANRPEWEGRQDFKKFKRKAPGEKRAPIQLQLSDPGDGGLGPAYWPKVTYSQLREEESQTRVVKAEAPAPAPKAKPRPQPKKRAYVEVGSDSGSDRAAPPAKTRQPPSRGGSRAGSAEPRRTQRATRGKAQPLFLPSDDDDEDADDARDGDFGAAADVTEDFGAELAAIAEDDDDDDADEEEAARALSNTLRSSNTRSQGARSQAAPAPRASRSQRAVPAPTPAAATQSKTRGAKKPAPIVVDDDSDDGVVFRGFGGKKGGR